MPVSPFDSVNPQFSGDIAPVPDSGGVLLLQNTPNVQAIIAANVESPVGGDLTGTPAKIAHITGNNSTSSYITQNVNCPGSAQTIIASASIAAGTWMVYATVSASVNAILAANAQEIALIPHGGAASVSYAATTVSIDSKGTEAGGSLQALVTVASLTRVDLVGSATGASPWVALAATTGTSFANATGITASPIV